MYHVYALIDPTNDEVFYVGCTKQKPKERLRQHKESLRRPSGSKKVKSRIALIQQQGTQPEIFVLEQTNDKMREKYWIDCLRGLGAALLNKARPGGGSRKKLKEMSPEQRKRIQEYQKEYHAQYRLDHAEELREYDRNRPTRVRDQRAYAAKYRAKNADKIREYQIKYRRLNKAA